MAGQTVVVSVLADTKKFSQGFKNLASDPGLAKLQQLGSKVGEFAKKAALAGGVALGALAVQGIRAAGDLEQSIGAIDAVFKGSADQMHAWANTAATDVGLAKNEFNELGTLIGAQLKNGGTAMEQLAPKTRDLIGLGADLSSMFGGTTREAVEALSSALKGERDPIERYGVSLNQAKIDAEAAALGFKKVGGSFDSQAQQAATLSLIMKQTADAQGNFGRESETLAHKQQVLAAEWQNLTATLGTYLLPIATQVVGFLSDNMAPALAGLQAIIEGHIIPAFQQLGAFLTNDVMPALHGFGQWASENQEALTVIAAMVLAAATAFGIWQGAIALWTGVQLVANTAVAAFNLVLAANPIMLVVMAIAALVAGLVIFFTQTEAGRQAWATFTNFLKSAWGAVVSWFSSTLANVKKWFSDAANNVQSSWTAVQAFFSGLPARIMAFFASAATWLLQRGREILDGLRRGAENAWSAVSSFMASIPGRIKGALAGAGSWLLGIGGSIITGLYNGISNKINWVVGMVRGIGSRIIDAAKSVFGIRSPSRVFAGIGDNIVAGLEQGLSDTSGVRDAVGRLSNAATGAFNPDLTMNAALAGGNGTTNVYSFDGLTFQAATAAEAELLEAFVTMARRKARARG